MLVAGNGQYWPCRSAVAALPIGIGQLRGKVNVQALHPESEYLTLGLVL